MSEKFQLKPLISSGGPWKAMDSLVEEKSLTTELKGPEGRIRQKVVSGLRM